MCRTDGDYVACCLDGHPEAFRQLVLRYQGVLMSYLTGRLADLDRAEEAAQETFVRAYFALGKLAKPESFFSWLLGIAGRVAKEQHRQRHRQWVEQEVARAWADRQTAEPERPSDLALKQAIGELAEPYRDVVLLRYYGGRTCGQVAEQLGIPLGTVTKRLSRAYAMLRESLGREDGCPERPEVRS